MILQSISRNSLEENFYKLAIEVLNKVSLELYDMSYIANTKILRLFVINAETDTATLDECVAVNKAIDPYFEELEWIPEGVTLEVSSPGIFRQLKTLDHLKDAVGKRVKLSLNTPINDASLPRSIRKERKIVSSIVEVKDNGLEMTNNDKNFFVEFENIKKANLEPQL